MSDKTGAQRPAIEDDPVVATFEAYTTLKFPHPRSADARAAFTGINKHWYGEPDVPIPTPAYAMSEQHLQATYAMLRTRRVHVRVDLHASGAWTIHPDPIKV